MLSKMKCINFCNNDNKNTLELNGLQTKCTNRKVYNKSKKINTEKIGCW